MPFPVSKLFDLTDGHLTEVGRVAIEWSHLEYKLKETLARLLGICTIDFDRQAAVTAHLSYLPCLEIIGSTARAIPLEDDLITEWDEIRKEANEQRYWRNVIIHDEWSMRGPKDQSITRTTARQGKGVKRTFYVATIDETAQTAKDIKAVRIRLEEWTKKLPLQP